MRRSITSAQLLVELATEHGIAPTACLLGSGITLRMLEDPHAEIDAQQELAVVRHLVRLLGDRPGIGLDAGGRYNLTAYGIWGYALLSSPTVGSAAELGVRYLGLTYMFNPLELQIEGGEMRFVFDDRGVAPDLRQFLLERDSAALLKIGRQLSAEHIAPRRVQFSFPRPANARRFRQVFRAPVSFGRKQTQLAWDARLADLPLPQAQERTAQVCEAHCRQLLARRRSRGEVSGSVRERLLQQPGRMPSMEEVAADLAMTSRTLRRRLASEGTSFRTLVSELREVLADEMLAATNMTIEEIAERLGYSEAASFIHAFKRWKGSPPRRQRPSQ